MEKLMFSYFTLQCDRAKDHRKQFQNQENGEGQGLKYAEKFSVCQYFLLSSFAFALDQFEIKFSIKSLVASGVFLFKNHVEAHTMHLTSHLLTNKVYAPRRVEMYMHWHTLPSIWISIKEILMNAFFNLQFNYCSLGCVTGVHFIIK